MGSLVTSLHLNYQPNLDVLWALRELCSNAIDGEERYRHLNTGKMVVDYSSRSQTLTIRNEGVRVPATALLMGTSESRGDHRCIGQFGEGLPMALLILARNHVPVVIVNGNEKWTPIIERSSAYGNEPVLAIETRKLPTERDFFEVEIKGVSKEMYQDFRGLYLSLDERFDPKLVAKNLDTDESVLLQSHYAGCIYNKGVFVARRGDLIFGYDLKGELNRDRSMMDEYTLGKRLHDLLREACYANDDFLHTLSELLVDREGVLEVTRESSDLVWHSSLRIAVTKIFKDRYGDNAIAVTNEEEVEEAERLGFRGVRCSNVLREMINRSTGSLLDKKRQFDRTGTVVEVESMGEIERRNFFLCVRMIQSVVPEARSLKFRVVQFTSTEVCYAVVDDNETVDISINVLLDVEQTILNLVTGVTESRSLWGQTTKILTRLIGQLVSSGPSSPLALSLLAEA